jgi:hypothetical protein
MSTMKSVCKRFVPSPKNYVLTLCSASTLTTRSRKTSMLPLMLLNSEIFGMLADEKIKKNHLIAFTK